MLGNYRVASQLVASGVELSSVELVNNTDMLKEHGLRVLRTSGKKIAR
jgi:hypothetical protein